MMSLSCTVSEIFNVESWRALQMWSFKVIGMALFDRSIMILWRSVP